MKKVFCLIALLVVLSGCGARVGNSFVIGTPSIHELDNERLKISGAVQGS